MQSTRFRAWFTLLGELMLSSRAERLAGVKRLVSEARRPHPESHYRLSTGGGSGAATRPGSPCPSPSHKETVISLLKRRNILPLWKLAYLSPHKSLWALMREYYFEGDVIKHLRRSGAESNSSQLRASRRRRRLLYASRVLFPKVRGVVVLLLIIYAPRIFAWHCTVA